MTKMTKTTVSRIHSAEAIRNGGGVPKGSFTGRAQRTVAKGGSRPPNTPSTTGKPSGGGRGNNPPKGK